MLEQWKPVIGFEGRYEVSSLGRVRSLDSVCHGLARDKKTKTIRPYKGRVLRAAAKSNGYLQITLCGSDGNRISACVHVLVMTAFVGPVPDNMQVRHLDGNQLNNKLGNLLYGTSVENAADRVFHGTNLIGSRHHQAKITERDAAVIKTVWMHFSKEDLARAYGLHKHTINSIISGRNWSHVSVLPEGDMRAAIAETERRIDAKFALPAAEPKRLAA